MTGKKKLKRGIKKKYKFCVNILTEEIWNGIFTGLIFTKYLQPQMFLFHWIRKETNTNNLFFLIKFMVFLRTTFYKTSVNNSEKNPCSVLIFFCCCCFTTIQSAFYIPQKNALRTVSEDLSSSSVSLWVLLKLSLSVCKHKLLADLLLLKFPQIAGELFSFIAIPWNHCWDLLLCRLSQISFCTKQTKGTNKKKMPQMLLFAFLTKCSIYF